MDMSTKRIDELIAYADFSEECTTCDYFSQQQYRVGSDVEWIPICECMDDDKCVRLNNTTQDDSNKEVIYE